MEPTPSPYSMKINVDEELADGQTENYKLDDDLSAAPEYIKKLFAIHGVKGLYRVIDFIALERNPRVAWEEILPEVRKVLGSEDESTDLFSKAAGDAEDAFGEVNVLIQMIRYIPTQVKLDDGDNEKRFALPERFMEAGMKAAEASDNYLMERTWSEQKPRYGDMDDIGNDVVEELSATYDSERLNELVELALNNESQAEERRPKKVTLDMLDQPNWKDRYAALDRMNPQKRSEEHTSELQSRGHLVCRLLLEKKKE